MADVPVIEIEAKDVGLRATADLPAYDGDKVVAVVRTTSGGEPPPPARSGDIEAQDDRIRGIILDEIVSGRAGRIIDAMIARAVKAAAQPVNAVGKGA